MTQSIPETPAEYENTRIIERPDGFYWRYLGVSEEFGPFGTLIEAVEDMKDNADATLESEQTLAEVENELGISDWVDPETGEPAEGFGPHLEDH